MYTPHITKHRLQNYRNFTNYDFEIDTNLILITGQNGSGKTNILESISYLSPGKGLRSSNFDLIARNSEFAWQTNSTLNSKLGIAEISAEFDMINKKRRLLYNGSKISSNEISRLINIIWLTPQMNDIFTATKSLRRRFLDRMVFGFFKNHSSNINKLDHFQTERLKHLTNNIGKFDDSWLKVLESKISEIGFEVDIARRKTISYMQGCIDSLNSDFPKALISIDSFDDQIKIDDNLEDYNKADFCTCYAEGLKDNRSKDAYSARTNYGVQKIDLVTFYKDKRQNANICSTGEQKALLISLFIAQINAIIDKTKATPILLLDELFVHLDDLRKQLLSDYVINSPAQVFITSTDDYGISDIAKNSQRIKLEKSHLQG